MNRTRVSQNGQDFWGRRISILVVVFFVSTARYDHILFGHWWRTDLVLVQRDEVANDSVVELERALVLGKGLRVSVEASNDVVAVLARADRVGELATSPVVRGNLARGVQQPVESGQLVVDGGVFEGRVEDVHR